MMVVVVLLKQAQTQFSGTSDHSKEIAVQYYLRDDSRDKSLEAIGPGVSPI